MEKPVLFGLYKLRCLYILIDLLKNVRPQILFKFPAQEFGVVIIANQPANLYEYANFKRNIFAVFST